VLDHRGPALFLPEEKSAERFFGFFTANIRNKNTRRAYYKAACRFSDWCEGRELSELGEVKERHVAAYIEQLGLPAASATLRFQRKTSKALSPTFNRFTSMTLTGSAFDTPR
jgi:site-specific recombinase XerD